MITDINNVATARVAALQRGGAVGGYTFGIQREVWVNMPWGHMVVDMTDPIKGLRVLSDFIISCD